jgi:hypothetical protein
VFSYGGTLASKDEDLYRRVIIEFMTGRASEQERDILRRALADGAIVMTDADAFTRDGVLLGRNCARIATDHQ